MRRYEFLDPGDRSPNAPGVMASSTRVKALFNQAHPQEKAENVSQRVRDWFENANLERGWSQVEWVGNEALLRKDFPSDQGNGVNS